jgi:uncharacterized protein YjcR
MAVIPALQLPEHPPSGEFLDPRRLARSLFWRGWGIRQLVEELNEVHRLSLNEKTVQSWKTRDKWDQAPMIARCEDVLEQRYCMLVAKESKTGHDFKEIDLLGRQITAMARVRRYSAPGGHEGDLNEKVANRNAGPRAKPKPNHLTQEQQQQLLDAFEQGLFKYQIDWRGSTALATRFILKSRQIGATFYFAREALIRAIETGNNQIFISASRNQANLFKTYIADFVLAVTGVALTGDPIILSLDGVTGPNGEPPKLYFLGTNYRTAQGYHGDVFVDECFWIHGFEQIWKVASAMASQKRYRKTIFSTPSTIAHAAYRLWNGDMFNARRTKDEQVKLDISHEALKAGALGPDGIWRQIVTLLDADAGGCDLFDVDELRLEYGPDEFDQLFLCQFIDDSKSMFPFSIMRACMVDSWDEWEEDFDPYALMPFGNGEVWIGYDPQESAAGDDGACVVVAPPKVKGGKFRVLEKFRWRGLDFEEQAAKLEELTARYPGCSFIGIDTTGIGAAVYQLVRKFFPMATKFDYSVPLKTAMVLKAKNVISRRRLEFDAGAIDIAQSFMAINAELTSSQRQVTYTASRAGDTGHADLAWAVMHALYNEPLDGEQPSASNIVEIS